MGKKSKKGHSSNKAHHGSAKPKHSSGPKTNVSAAATETVVTDNEPVKPDDNTAPVVSHSTEASSNATTEIGITVVDTVEVADATDKNEHTIPMGLVESFSLFTPEQRLLAETLCMHPNNQTHLFENWNPASADSDEVNNKKKALLSQLQRMDHAYSDGGLVGYIRNAKALLEKSKQGLNPLDGWVPSVPQGQLFQLGTNEFSEVESLGLSELGKCGFILVAGGLGERLGYSGIKIALPVELASGMTYLQYYIKIILAIQSRYANKGVKLPLCIMVSNDTIKGTLQLLKEHGNYGLDDDQITIVQQGEGVPALVDNQAHIALDSHDIYKVESKPHGHGDIHSLIYSNDVANKWHKQGIEWAIFFQDTNGLAFQTLPLSLGVSKKLGLIMNSLAVPRKAKQAIGGIAKLMKDDGQERTINVEYNQLDPLLRATGFPDGDVNDPKTGFSPFPGNINQLLFHLEEYSHALNRTKGIMPEFVNPKYADVDKTIFKKPTRLECMMQDFPTVLEGEDAKKVGFTSIAADLCFSPVKNATADGVVLQNSGTHPGVAASGEADQYASTRKILSSIGCNISEAAPVSFNGITITPGPEIVLDPSFAIFPAECKLKFPNPSSVKISQRSSLVIHGNCVIESLDLDGALVIECEDGATGVIRNLTVKNAGWDKVPCDTNECDEVLRMRGFYLKKNETETIVIKKDDDIEGPSNVDLSVPAVVDTQNNCCVIS